MAFCVKVFRFGDEDEKFIFYTYEFSRGVADDACEGRRGRRRLESVCGTLRMSKKNGDVELVRLANGDTGSNAKRAAWALIREWKKGKFPDEVWWAS